MRRCVWSRNLVNEEALAHWGLSRQKQTNKQTNKRHIIRRTYVPGRTPLNEWPACRWDHNLHNIQPTKEKNIHALSGIRTGDFSKQASVDPYFRKYGHRDRMVYIKGLHKGGVLCSTTIVMILTHLSNYTTKYFLISMLLSWPFVCLPGTLMCIHVHESHWPLDRIMGQFDTAQICTIFLNGTLFCRLETVEIRFIPIYGHLIPYRSHSNMFRLTYIYIYSHHLQGVYTETVFS